MTATADDLARRLVESRHWRWLPGCLYLRPETRIASGPLPYLTRRGRYEDYEMWGLPCGTVPIIGEADPATEGCLRRLASDAWGRFVSVRPVDRPGGLGLDAYGMDPEHGWAPLVDPDGRHVTGPFVGEALAHAILAAPGVPHGR